MPVATGLRSGFVTDSRVVMSVQDPIIGRIVVEGQTPDDLEAVEELLLDALSHRWPEGAQPKFLLTPGGFIRTTMPKTWSGASGWESRPRDLKAIIAAAERSVAKVVTARVLAAAQGRVRAITVGIDVADPDDDDNGFYEHAELVAVYHVAGDVSPRWTGKSYPTAYQANTLIQVTDLQSHLMRIAGERVLVLGCHDLNMFSRRAMANQKRGGFRWRRCQEMRDLVARFDPTVVLQHPHSTDTPDIWRVAWSGLKQDAPSLVAWASGLSYFRVKDGSVRPCRAPLKAVQAATRSDNGTCFDLVVDASEYGHCRYPAKRKF